MQVFHAVFQGWRWTVKPLVLLLLTLFEANGIYLCMILGEWSLSVFDLCVMAPGDLYQNIGTLPRRGHTDTLMPLMSALAGLVKIR